MGFAPGSSPRSFFHFLCSTAPQAFSVPTAEFPSRHAQIGQGRPPLRRLVLLNASRPRLDRIEHAGMLDASGR